MVQDDMYWIFLEPYLLDTIQRKVLMHYIPNYVILSIRVFHIQNFR